jgi:recombination protein RecR
MLLNSPAVEQLIEAFRRLPGVGKRSAERMAMYLLSAPETESAAFSKAVLTARARIVHCGTCRNLAESDPCTICANERRDHSVVCVVEQPTGAMAIEKGGTYKGLYHVLHGVLNPLDGVGPQELHLDSFFERIKRDGIREVVVATNATAEGEATAMYLSRQLAQSDVQVTRIAHGVPMGGGLEFADDLTLSHAMQGRMKID